jgi:hypothetical protein
MPSTPIQGVPRSVGLRATGGHVRGNPTQPAPSQPSPQTRQATTGAQGSPGGRRGQRPGRSRPGMVAGTNVYLWILLVAEVVLVGGLRQLFKKYHGG